MRITYWVDTKTGTYGELSDIRILEIDEYSKDLVRAFEDENGGFRCDLAENYGLKVNTFRLRWYFAERRFTEKLNSMFKR